ncbi:uncharacterized protein HMPREF1541_08544 [Cyphellophora europaea CBS 101466]|uniref:Cystathionine beta-lyase n=1 Tax=Cyphellophora europaea (strain CBS 101466) TaxID=1220924 RepID=W2RIC8_CYPE1|nr:uncharacterized protein HMPREF1541_08544 [Cyphellophora europaea CBS 101466]ETN36267.1 hypothetical protein HMPREF1541_08544 [Cyphellophora europaea CBS 101466]
MGNDASPSGRTPASPPQSPSSAMKFLSPATQAVHGDDVLNVIDDVAPPIHLTTTYRYPRDPDLLRPHHERPSYPVLDFGEHCYSRQSTPGLARVEGILTLLLKQPTVAYSSGLAAFHALLTMLAPKRVAIGAGYHGCHGVLNLYARASGCQILPLDCNTEELGPGDLIHLETPVNPTGLALNIQHHATKAHSRGAYLSVDSTFAPPPLQEPFALGADVVMHSGTKYLGGHSDFLCGVLACKNTDWVQRLYQDRLYLGSVMSGFDSWLLVRSLRTLELRVLRQSQAADYIVRALYQALQQQPSDLQTGCGDDSGGSSSSSSILSADDANVVRGVVKSIQHASVQPAALESASCWLRQQMPRGYGPVFGLTLHSASWARRFPSKLLLFHHATSLGGVESLIEWRTMTDATVGRDVLRVSVGVERKEDLLADLVRGMREVWAEGGGEGVQGRAKL